MFWIPEICEWMKVPMVQERWVIILMLIIIVTTASIAHVRGEKIKKLEDGYVASKARK